MIIVLIDYCLGMGFGPLILGFCAHLMSKIYVHLRVCVGMLYVRNCLVWLRILRLPTFYIGFVHETILVT